MNATWVRNPLPTARLLSWGAKVCGVMLFVGWVVFVINELAKNHFVLPGAQEFYQAGVLAVVFVGYLVTRRHALVGSALAIGGTICYFAVVFMTSGMLPELNAAWFAAPAVLTLAAWTVNRLRRRQSAHGWHLV